MKEVGIKSAGFVDGDYQVILTDGSRLLGVQRLILDARVNNLTNIIEMTIVPVKPHE